MGILLSCCGWRDDGAARIGAYMAPGAWMRYFAARPPEPEQTCLAAEADLADLALRGRLGLVVAIDYTSSNNRNGRVSFGGRPLHTIALVGAQRNPYEEVIGALRTLHEACGAPDGAVPPVIAFGFGDNFTSDERVFRFAPPPEPDCATVDDLLVRYREITPEIVLSGPTSFAPALRRAAALVEETQRPHALVLIVDGAPMRWEQNVAALRDVSVLALYVVCVCVGDSAFTLVESMARTAADECMFPNFSFVNFRELRYTDDGADRADWQMRTSAAVLAAVAAQAQEARNVGAKYG